MLVDMKNHFEYELEPGRCYSQVLSVNRNPPPPTDMAYTIAAEAASNQPKVEYIALP